MKRSLRLAAFLVLFYACSARLTAAGHTPGSTGVAITNVDVRSDGTFVVYFSQAAIGSASCVTTQTTAMTGTTTTAGGRALLSTALSLFLAKRNVYLEGTNTCNEYTGYESIYRIYAY